MDGFDWNIFLWCLNGLVSLLIAVFEDSEQEADALATNANSATSYTFDKDLGQCVDGSDNKAPGLCTENDLATGAKVVASFSTENVAKCIDESDNNDPNLCAIADLAPDAKVVKSYSIEEMREVGCIDGSDNNAPDSCIEVLATDTTLIHVVAFGDYWNTVAKEYYQLVQLCFPSK